jgi:hypothetical protein
LELKSIKDDSPDRCVFRLFTANRPFEFEFFISKAMGLNGISPRILYEDHQSKFWVQEYVKDNIFLSEKRDHPDFRLLLLQTCYSSASL